MNVEYVDVRKKLRYYLLTLAVGTYADLANYIYTGPNEEIENKTPKYSITMEFCHKGLQNSCRFWRYETFNVEK